MKKILLRIITIFCFTFLGVIHVNAQKIERYYEDYSRNKIVDLGLSVRWARWNIGATCPEELGGLYGWGDAWGEKRSKNLKDYPSKNPPTNICGDAKWDIATARWGYPFRLPTYAEALELLNECTWQPVFGPGGHYGYKITGPNGNSIFLPSSSWRKGKKLLSPTSICLSYENALRTKYGQYWIGEICRNNKECAYVLFFDFSNYSEYCKYQNRDISDRERYYGLCVRAVCDSY